MCSFFLIFKDFIYLFLEGKVERKRGRENRCERETWMGRHSYAPRPGTDPAPKASALTGNQTSELMLCGVMPSPLTEAHWSGLQLIFNVLGKVANF